MPLRTGNPHLSEALFLCRRFDRCIVPDVWEDVAAQVLKIFAVPELSY